jgi:HSP20 family molecular chaperone IbpA
MNDFFKDVFGEFNFFFDRQFNYDCLGMRTYRHFYKDNKEILSINVAGFSKSDIKLEPKTVGEKEYIYIIGTPNDDMKDYIEPLNLRVAIKSNIDTVSGEVKDGMLYLTLTKKDIKPKINIEF